MKTYQEFTEEFWKNWELAKKEGNLRLGQFYFNELYKEKPNLANKIRATDKDMFYNNDKLAQSLDFIYDNWNKS